MAAPVAAGVTHANRRPARIRNRRSVTTVPPSRTGDNSRDAVSRDEAVRQVYYRQIGIKLSKCLGRCRSRAYPRRNVLLNGPGDGS